MLTFPITAPVAPSGHPLDYAWGMLAVALFYLAPLGASWLLLRRLAGDGLPAWLRLPLSLALSPLLLALPIFAAGLAGVLFTPVVIFILLAFLPFYRGQKNALWGACRELLGKIHQLFRKGSWLVKAACALVLILVFFSLIRALAPTIDNDCIGIPGGLTLAVNYAEQGAMPIAKGNVNFGAPHLFNLLFAALYLLRAAAAPTFLAASQTLLFAAIIAGFSAFWWGRNAAPFAALLFLLNKVALQWGEVPRTDIPVALLGVISIFLWVEWMRKSGRGLLLAASLFAGLAVATKITWWLILPAEGLLFLCADQRLAWRSRLTNMLLFFILPVLLITPWVLRSQLLTGTPVYPLTWRYTGGKYWSEPEDQLVRKWEHNWCAQRYPTLSVAPLKSLKMLCYMLKINWPFQISLGFSLLALFCLKSARRRVVLLLLAALIIFLAVTGFLDSDLRHYIAAIAICNTIAAGVLALFVAGQLSKKCKVMLVALGLIAFISNTPLFSQIAIALTGSSPKARDRWKVEKTYYADVSFLPDFLPLLRHRIDLQLPDSAKAQIWVNQHSPTDAIVMTAAPAQIKWHPDHRYEHEAIFVNSISGFYLRRRELALEDLVYTNNNAPIDYDSRLEELKVSYLILPIPGISTRIRRWDWQQGKFVPFNELESIKALLRNTVSTSEKWQLVYTKGGFEIYKKGRPIHPPSR